MRFGVYIWCLEIRTDERRGSSEIDETCAYDEARSRAELNWTTFTVFQVF